MDSLELLPLLRGINPYHLRARGVASVCEIVKELLDREELKLEVYLFHDFMRSLSFMVAEERLGARKSKSVGIDFELEREGVQYLILVGADDSSRDDISHPEWLARADNGVDCEKPQRDTLSKQPTLGIYFGASERRYEELVLIVKGQAFWELISGEPGFHEDVSDLIGHYSRDIRAHSDYSGVNALNRLSRDFFTGFCRADGSIDWPKIVTLVSKNV